MRVFVEPLLLWKGDTAAAPSGTQFTEGSITRPRAGVPDGVPSARDSARNETQVVDHAGLSIPVEIRNNPFSALYQNT